VPHPFAAASSPSAYASLSAGVDQWRRHAATFVARPAGPAWSHHRHAFQELLSMALLCAELRGGPALPKQLRDRREERGQYCEPWRHYAAAAEALAELDGCKLPDPPGGEPGKPGRAGDAADVARSLKLLREVDRTALAAELLGRAIPGAEESGPRNLPLLHSLLARVRLRRREFGLAREAAAAVVSCCPALGDEPAFGSVRHRSLCDQLTCAVELGDEKGSAELAASLLLGGTAALLSPPQVSLIEDLMRASPSPVPLSFANSRCRTPVEFHLTFPAAAFAIAGDTARASLLLRSRVPNAPLTIAGLSLHFSPFGQVEWEIPGGELTLPPGGEGRYEVDVPLPAKMASRRSSLQVSTRGGRSEHEERGFDDDI
jgi:hypothetical protein